MLAFTERNKDKITCMNISRHLVKYVEESPDEVIARIACPTRINCVLYKDYPAARAHGLCGAVPALRHPHSVPL